MRPVPPSCKKKMTPEAKFFAGAFHAPLTRICKGLVVYCSADLRVYGAEFFAHLSWRLPTPLRGAGTLRKRLRYEPEGALRLTTAAE